MYIKPHSLRLQRHPYLLPFPGLIHLIPSSLISKWLLLPGISSGAHKESKTQHSATLRFGWLKKRLKSPTLLISQSPHSSKHDLGNNIKLDRSKFGPLNVTEIHPIPVIPTQNRTLRSYWRPRNKRRAINPRRSTSITMQKETIPGITSTRKGRTNSLMTDKIEEG